MAFEDEVLDGLNYIKNNMARKGSAPFPIKPTSAEPEVDETIVEELEDEQDSLEEAQAAADKKIDDYVGTLPGAFKCAKVGRNVVEFSERFAHKGHSCKHNIAARGIQGEPSCHPELKPGTEVLRFDPEEDCPYYGGPPTP